MPDMSSLHSSGSNPNYSDLQSILRILINILIINDYYITYQADLNSRTVYFSIYSSPLKTRGIRHVSEVLYIVDQYQSIYA